MMCPPDMLVYRAGAGEPNVLTIGVETAGFQRLRLLVRDDGGSVTPGPGCEPVDPSTAVCIAGAIGPIELGDLDDRIASRSGDVSGGDGSDILDVAFGLIDGDGGDDVLIGNQGDGGAGDDLLLVTAGEGGAGDDDLRCYPRDLFCQLDGGPGDDRLTGGATRDRLLGRSGNDRLAGGRGDDVLACGRGRRDRALIDAADRVTGCERTTRAPGSPRS